MGLTELSREMGYGKSGVYKILSVLMAEKFVSQNPDNKRYYLGHILYRLGNVYIEQKRIWEVVEPIMREIVKITGETVSIGIREGDDTILAHFIESPHAIRLRGKLGRKYSINDGVIGKLMAAYHDPERVRELLAVADFKKKTPYTIVDPRILLKEYELIRERGYATSEQEYTEGVSGIAAPIYDFKGRVNACLCLAGPAHRFTQEKMQEWAELVVAKAKEMSYLFGLQKDK